jgi:hypothetical protein
VIGRQEAQAVEADRAFRAALPKGIAWHQSPDGVSPVLAMTAAAKAERPRRRSMLEDSLDGGGTTMHILEPRPAFEDDAS